MRLASFPALLAAALACCALGAAAAEDSAADVRTLPASAMLGFERVRLPGDERMGLLGASYVLEFAPGWWLGPAVYGAATGHRGGLFTWGGEAQRRWRLGRSWGVVTGLYVGGGGGAAAPVGGGLMLRPHADLMVDFGGWQAGLTASEVRFPSGSISSRQIGLLVMVEDRFAHTAPGHAGQSVDFGSSRGGLGADRMQVVLGRYQHGGASGQSLGYVGLRLEQQATRNLSATLEAAGAAQGGADGYAEVLGGLQMQWALGSENVRLGVRGAAGLAGGGAVKTGAGPIAKAALSGRWQITPLISLSAEAGRARALLHGNFSTPYAQVSLGVGLGETAPGTAAWSPRRRLHDMEWSLGVEDYLHAARKDGSSRALSTISLKFRRSLSEHLYLTGQAHSAITGGAGAYSAGLVGPGVTTGIGSGWSAGAEALVGAAGGGGVASQGGAVAQPMLWLGRDLGRFSRLKVGAGYIKSAKGQLSSPVIDVSLAFEFGTP